MLRSTAGHALKNIPPAYLLFATLFLIFVGTLMPGQIKNDAHVLLGQHLPWPAFAHLVLFGVLASLPVYGAGWRGTWRALGLTLMAAVATELLQGLVPGRHPMLRDVGIDMAGALVGRVMWLRATGVGRLRPRHAPGRRGCPPASAQTRGCSSSPALAGIPPAAPRSD